MVVATAAESKRVLECSSIPSSLLPLPLIVIIVRLALIFIVAEYSDVTERARSAARIMRVLGVVVLIIAILMCAIILCFFGIISGEAMIIHILSRLPINALHHLHSGEIQLKVQGLLLHEGDVHGL